VKPEQIFTHANIKLIVTTSETKT